MKVSIELSPEYSEPYAIIYADKITDSIQRTLDIFGSNESPITALQNENDIVILQPKEIYMVFIVKYKCRKLQTKNVGRCNYIL